MPADLALRAAILLLAGLAAAAALRRAAAATRHRALTLTMLSVLALPAAAWMLPEWRILPAAGEEIRVAIDREADTISAALSSSQTLRSAPAPGARPAGVSFTMLWALGALLLFARMAAGILAVRRLVRRSRPAGTRWRDLLDRLLADTGETRPIRLLVSREIGMPMTWGTTRPVLMLPASADAWSDARARVVLLHELAHIRRADCLTHALARVAAALHWFNPLAWLVVRGMTRARERACDDFVLASGAPASEYAHHLLDIARAGLGPSYAMAPAMARRSELEGRLLSILTPHGLHSRRAAGHAMTLAALLATAALGAAAQDTWREPAVTEPLVNTPRAVMPHPGGDDATRQAVRQSIVVHREALRDPSRATREEAAVGLAIVEDDAAIDPLIAALQDTAAQVREKAALGLAFRSDPRVVEPLIAALADPSSQVREKAAMGLSLRQAPAAVEALIQAASDPNSQVREKVIVALGLSGDVRAADVVASAVQDPDPQVREKAVAALALGAVLRGGTEGRR